MRVIDARSGAELLKGSRVRYPTADDGPPDGFDVLAIEPGPLGGLWSAVIAVRYARTGQIGMVWCPVRWTLPGFFLRPVAIFPS